MTDEDNVFSRWSRRKRSKAGERESRPGRDPGPLAEATPDEVPGQARDALELAEPESEEEETALLEQLGLPKPETLSEGDDFSAFMKAGVPEFLRRRALRVLWRSNPVLANLDGLNDYDDDFNAPELTQKVLATGYQVGRGFLKQVTDAIEEEDAEKTAADLEEPVDNPLPEQEIAVAERVSEEVAEPEPVEEAAPRPRRMRFET